MGVGHLIAERFGQFDRYLPLVLAAERRHHLADAIDPPLGIGESAVLFEEGRAGEENMGEFGGLVQEQVLHDDAFHRPQGGGHMMGVGVRLGDVLAVDEQALERAGHRLVEHVGNAQARLVVERHAPALLEALAHLVGRDVAIAGEFVREAAHVAGALHVVLAAQRVHARAVMADIAGRHGEIGQRHDRGRALAVLGHAEPVKDRRVLDAGVKPRRRAHVLRRHAGIFFICFRRILLQRDEPRPGFRTPPHRSVRAHRLRSPAPR